LGDRPGGATRPKVVRSGEVNPAPGAALAPPEYEQPAGILGVEPEQHVEPLSGSGAKRI